MTDLFKLAGPAGEPTANIVFVHGLGGHPFDTWWSKGDSESFWPVWLARDLPGVAVWTMSYAAPRTNWFGNALHLTDRGISAYERIATTKDLRNRPIIFIAHSLGGLLVKQLLRIANDRREQSQEADAFLSSLAGIVFIATPHNGASIATLADKLRLLVWPSQSLADLVKNDSGLRDLNNWYRGWHEHPPSLNFYETEAVGPVLVVDQSSADGGVSDIAAIPIERSHTAICIPPDRNDLLYVRTLDFVQDRTGWVAPQPKPDVVVQSTSQYKVVRPFNLVPVLIRAAVGVIIVGLIVYWFFPRPPAPPLEPITDLAADIAWGLPSDFPGGQDLMARLAKAGERLVKDPALGQNGSGEMFTNMSSAQGEPLGFAVRRSSDLYPSREQDPILNVLVGETDAQFSCFATSLSADKALSAIEFSSGRPNLGYFSNYGDYAFETADNDSQDKRFVYDIVQKRITIWVGGPINRNFIRKNAKITYVIDIESSTCLLEPDYTVVDDLNNPSTTLTIARNSIADAALSIKFSGRHYFVRQSDIKRTTTKDGFTIFRFQMPKPEQ